MAPGIRVSLGGLTPREFLARHWQKRALLVRAALPALVDPLTPAELAGLACGPDVESRLVLTSGGKRPFELSLGPQPARRLRGLGKSHWTLLVQRADHHVPALADLLELFDFVPRWRLDDVMVSFATRGGTVGPHVDNYDVFLIQGGGRKRWWVQQRPDRELRDGLDLRVLRRFAPDEGWILEPGDMLYVPPGVAHHGVALADSFTYSVGFRAPSERALAAAFAARLFQQASAERLYADPDLRPPFRSGRISAAALSRLEEMLRGSVARTLREETRLLLATGLTEHGAPTPPPNPLRLPELRRWLRRGPLARNPASRAAYFLSRGTCFLLVDGQAHRLPRALEPLAAALTGARRVPQSVLARYWGRPGVTRLLLELVNAGAFCIEAPRPFKAASP